MIDYRLSMLLTLGSLRSITTLLLILKIGSITIYAWIASRTALEECIFLLNFVYIYWKKAMASVQLVMYFVLDPSMQILSIQFTLSDLVLVIPTDLNRASQFVSVLTLTLSL